MIFKEFEYRSFNKAVALYAWVLEPETEPTGIIQLVHGLGCHSGRYRWIAETLCSVGFVVCANDHVGHGKTAQRSGTFGQPGENAWRTFLEDEHTLRYLMAQQYPQLSFGMFGHSMGSMIGRLYAALYPEDQLKALALGGICQQNPGAEALIAIPEIGELVAQGRGPDMQLGAKYFAVLMEKANVRYPLEGPLAWLSRSEEVREEYLKDSLNNQVGNSLNMVHAFAELYRLSTDPEWDAKIPRKLPILLMAGDQDPCSNYGEGLCQAARALRQTGHPVECIAWSGYRHEAHNHPHIRDKVVDELIRFFKEKL